jgi:hypothetical protein
MTGANAAVGALLLARRGRDGRSGLVDPEVCFDPYEYIEELRRREGIHLAWSDRVVSVRPLERVS